ncbi:MAG TPA: outer membrane beta-barrel protein, partial [Caulobacteraceae bacterium]
MNKTLFAATAALALMAAMPAAAGEWYAQVNAGATVATDADTTATFTPDDTDFDPSSGSLNADLDEGFAVGAAAGYAIGNGFRVEGEFLYTSNDLGDVSELGVDNIEFNHAAFFANVLYDIPMDGSIYPYVGAGVGYGSSTFDIDSDEVHDEGTAWQIKVGATYPVNDTLT